MQHVLTIKVTTDTGFYEIANRVTTRFNIVRRRPDKITQRIQIDENYGWMLKRRSWHVEREWIINSPGVMQAINLAVQTFTRPGDGVIVQPPVFGRLADAVENNGRTLLTNPLRYVDGGYSMDFDHLEQIAGQATTKMLILCSPHNPVGRVWNREELERLGTICLVHDLHIVSDEVHANLIYPWATYSSLGAVDERFHDRLLVATGGARHSTCPVCELR